MVKCIAWNIRAGGGIRSDRIVHYLVGQQPDVIALSEFRATAPSISIAQALAVCGYRFQRSTACTKTPAVNALLIASRWPLRSLSLKHAPDNHYRWLAVNVAAPEPFSVMALHVPNRSTGLKYPFQQAVVDVLKGWRGLPAIVMGDTNSGKIDIDEETRTFNRVEHQWLESIEALGWCDAFRSHSPAGREYTWYSPNGRNGFRLDQMFVHPSLAPRVKDFQHQWAGATEQRLEVLSDHAAMILEFV